MKVAVIGAGYVGLTTALSLAYVGHEVVGVDLDTDKVARLNRGELPFYEPHAKEMLALVRERLRFTARYEEAIPQAEVIFIAVGTPSLPDGASDLSQVRSAAQAIGRHLGEGFTVVVNKSTVPVGSGNYVEALVRRAFQQAHRGEPDGRLAVASNPEFLREGQALYDSLYPDRIVVGAEDRRAIEVLRELYEPILEQSFTPPPFLPRPERMGAVPFLTTDLASAELIKYGANAFLALKISFINELARLAEKVGADIREVARGIGLDHRIGTLPGEPREPGELRVLELAQLVKELTGSPSPITFLPLPEDDPKQRRPDITLARRLLGWEPRVPVREGLKRTIAYFREVVAH
ncbi:nucleotide sugar dehydrogenase [Thermus aquaticus]|uniref:nucleotide sugar dehydrogenase n=1 Tax=Thermus aquaticus TaxID=271 RepID=UPI00017E6175|nr:nucleotide sugar dehydrogenase [Thermus aquaticus]